MEGLKDKVDHLTQHIEEFATTYYDLTVANITKKSAEAASAGIGFALVCIFSFFIVLFAALAGAWWAGDLLENRAAGFLAMGGLFLVLLLLLLLIRKSVIYPYIRNMIVKNMYD